MAFSHANKRFALRNVGVANPAAGAEWTVTVPTGVVWKMQTIKANFTPSGTVANRFPRIVVQDAAGNVVFVSGSNNSPISNGSGQVIVLGLAMSPPGQQNTASIHNLPIPPNFLVPEGYTISTNTVGIQVGDQWSSIFLLVEESSSLA